MKNLLFLLVAALLMPVGQAPAQPLTSAIAGSTLVCVGANASAEVKQAAEQIAAKLRAAGGPQNNLTLAETLNQDPLAAGQHHIIAVGTWSDNVVLRKTWGHWAMTSAQRQSIERERERTRAQFPAEMLTSPEVNWRWPGDFYAFGFGHFSGSIGYLEPCRNFYALQLVSNELGPRWEDLPMTDQLFVFKITGSDAAGVVRAAQAFEQTSLLHAVLPGAVQTPDEWTPVALGKPQFTTAPPAYAPTKDVGDAKYVGWMQGYSLLYAGFAEASGVAPQRLWRLKYSTPAGFKEYMDFLTARASDNELLIVEVADAAAAQSAVENLRGGVGTDWQPYTVGGWKGFRSAEGHTFLHQGNSVVSESLPVGLDEVLLKSLPAP